MSAGYGSDEEVCMHDQLPEYCVVEWCACMRILVSAPLPSHPRVTHFLLFFYVWSSPVARTSFLSLCIYGFLLVWRRYGSKRAGEGFEEQEGGDETTERRCQKRIFGTRGLGSVQSISAARHMCQRKTHLVHAPNHPNHSLSCGMTIYVLRLPLVSMCCCFSTCQPVAFALFHQCDLLTRTCHPPPAVSPAPVPHIDSLCLQPSSSYTCSCSCSAPHLIPSPPSASHHHDCVLLSFSSSSLLSMLHVIERLMSVLACCTGAKQGFLGETDCRIRW